MSNSQRGLQWMDASKPSTSEAKTYPNFTIIINITFLKRLHH